MNWDEQSRPEPANRQSEAPPRRASEPRAAGSQANRRRESQSRRGDSRPERRRSAESQPERRKSTDPARRRRSQPERRRSTDRERRTAGGPEQRRRTAQGQPERQQTARPERRPARKPDSRRRRPAQRRTPPRPLPRRRLIRQLVTTGAVVLALILGLTIFFRVQNIRVTGNGKYTAQEIIDASGIDGGENLLLLGKSKAAGQILNRLPYVDQVQIGIKLPNTVNIDIVELEAVYAVSAAGGGWWLMDDGGKLLEPVEDAGAHIQVTGIQAENPTVGATLTPAADPEPETQPEGETEPQANGDPAARAAAALTILQTLQEVDRTAEITRVDVSALYDLQVWYGDDYQVLLGGPEELAYKTRYMVQAVAELQDRGYRGGVLDLQLTEPGKATFTPW
ncbi:MAG TPA: FtsQ-type POTRA domain-containing protein [Candidatus Faecousia faecigallinarum]|nr:FtsQ-type POTRA domain-containing protein [Candidatus Faecousia faecigallinarum]